MMLAIIILLLLIAFAARAGLSYVAQYRVNAAIDGWQLSLNKKSSLDDWQNMLSSLETMLEFDGRNPDLHNAKARLYAYRAARIDTDRGQRSEDYKQAMQGYRTVIALRPAWPYGYVNLLYAKVFNGELDAEMQHSLLRAIKLSPWEKNTLPDIVKVAVFVWPGLDMQSKKITKAYLLQASEKRRGEFEKALISSQLKDYFCQTIVKTDRLTLCQAAS